MRAMKIVTCLGLLVLPRFILLVIFFAQFANCFIDIDYYRFLLTLMRYLISVC